MTGRQRSDSRLKLITGALGQTRAIGWAVVFASVATIGLVAGVAADSPAGSAPGAGVHGMSRAAVRLQVQALAALGHALFFDPSLSSSGQVACSTCHDPAHAFGPPNALAVQLAGTDMLQPGVRAVPSLKYLQAVPSFTEHFFESEDDADESIDNGPTGGLTWDGRSDRGRDQAGFPLMSAFEMGNKDQAEVAGRVLAGGYGERIAAIAGPGAATD